MGNARKLFFLTRVKLLVKRDLASPLQTLPSAVDLEALPKAGGHVVFLLLQGREDPAAEVSFTCQRICSLSMNFLAVIF